MKAVKFEDSKPLPSYLVAFVVGPFELVDGGRAGRANTPIRFIVPRGRAAETRYAREVTPRIVVELEKYFDMPYPYGKLDVAVVPRFWGTMEHPGIVALGQPLTLIKPTEEGLHRKESYANIAIHELAHYWFGDYVTCAGGTTSGSTRRSAPGPTARSPTRSSRRGSSRSAPTSSPAPWPPTDSRRRRRSACPSRPRTPSRTRSTTRSPTPRARRCCT